MSGFSADLKRIELFTVDSTRQLRHNRALIRGNACI
jgi:hypothetical protein